MSDKSASDSESSDHEPSGTESSGAESSGAVPVDEHRNPALIALAIALPVALIVGIIVAAMIAARNPVQEPVALGSVPAPKAQSAECSKLVAALPKDLGEWADAEMAKPAPPATKAWRKDDGSEPIVLRCGLDRPQEFNRAAALQLVDKVQWFQVSGASTGIKSSTWFVVDRGVYVALTVPDGSGPTPLQDVSDTITKILPQQPIDPAPLPN